MRQKIIHILESQTVLFLSGFAIAGALVAAQGGITRAIDSPAPQISGAKVQVLNATSAVITWTTDKDSDGLINYGTNPAYGVARDTNFSTKIHTVAIDNLEPLTTYFFRVISADSQANQGISEGYTFTTPSALNIEDLPIEEPRQRRVVEEILADLEEVTDPDAIEIISEKVDRVAREIIKPPVVMGEPRLEIESDAVTIYWTTDKESDSLVGLIEDARYDANSDDPYSIKQGDPDERAKNHIVRVIGLRPATKYQYEVFSKPEVGPVGRSGAHAFTTKAIAPKIFDIKLEKVQEDSATISFRTNAPASAVIEYINLKTQEKKSVGNPAMLTAHIIQLPSLKFATEYSAVIRTENETGDQDQSPPIRFKTVRDEAPPVITKVNNESTLFPGEDTKVQTIVTWKTDEVAQCQFFFQASIIEGVPPESLPIEADPLTDHVQVVTIFQPATVYKFWVECTDRTGNHSRSDDFVLFTPQKEKSIIDIIIENFEGSFGWVKKIGK